MIILSNGHQFEYMVASGALSFDGQGWWWERPLVWLGLIRPELFTVVLKTLTRYPRKGNLCWHLPWTWLPFSPWSCVRFLPGGAVNKVGLTNPGIEWWCEKIGPRLDFQKFAIAGSIFGQEAELVEMARMFNRFDFVAIEINVSCPNADHDSQTEAIVKCAKRVKMVSRHPVIVKVSVDQDYLAIADKLFGVVEAMSFNSVKWEMIYPGDKSPLRKLEKKVGGGGGGVSGKPAQIYNWIAVKTLAMQTLTPVIAPGVMCKKDLKKVLMCGAGAISFGAIHLRTPWKPTSIVRKEMRVNQ